MKTDLETDLFVAHCKIESLESCLEQYKVIFIKAVYSRVDIPQKEIIVS